MDSRTMADNALQMQEIKAYLNGALTRISHGSTVNGSPINTRAVIYSIAKALPHNLGTLERKQFEKLCRKVEIAKVVYERYNGGWEKDEEAKEIETSYWVILSAMFLLYAEAKSDCLAISTKWLNATLTAIELGKHNDKENSFSVLEEWAKRRLRKIVDRQFS